MLVSIPTSIPATVVPAKPSARQDKSARMEAVLLHVETNSPNVAVSVPTPKQVQSIVVIVTHPAKKARCARQVNASYSAPLALPTAMAHAPT